jgi:large subunit ribosomal protein L29
MKCKDIRGKSAEELLSTMKDISEALFTKRFQTEVEQMTNPSEIRHMRHDIARIKTVLREKGIRT